MSWVFCFLQACLFAGYDGCESGDGGCGWCGSVGAVGIMCGVRMGVANGCVGMALFTNIPLLGSRFFDTGSFDFKSSSI